MNRRVRRRMLVVGAASSMGILSPVWGPMVMRELPGFGITEVDVVGASFVPGVEVESLAGLDDATSVWDDMRSAEAAVSTHPLILGAAIRRTGLRAVEIRVSEVKPAALVADPVLVPVDASGYRLPIDPSRQRVDLPILVDGRLDEAGRVEPEAARRALGLLDQLSRTDSSFAARVSSLRPLHGEAVEFTLLPGSSADRVVIPVRDGVRALLRVERAIGAASSGRRVVSADARFRRRVVLRLEAGA